MVRAKHPIKRLESPLQKHTAIVDLYKIQVSQKVNSYLYPDFGKTIQELKSVKRDKVDRMKQNCIDHSREGFRMESFTKEQLHAVSDHHWKHT